MLDTIDKNFESNLQNDENGKLNCAYKKVIEYLKDESGKIQKEKLMKILKSVSTYKDKDGIVREACSTIYYIWNCLPEHFKEEHFMEAMQILSTYTDENGVIKEAFSNVTKIWKQLPIEFKEKNCMNAIKKFSTYTDEKNNVKEAYSTVYDIWKYMPEKFKKEHFMEAMQILSTYTDENGVIKEAFSNVTKIWKQLPIELKEKNCMNAIKKFSTYTDEKNNVKEAYSTAYNIWIYTTEKFREEHFMEALQILSTYKDEKGKIQEANNTVGKIWNSLSPETQEKNILNTVEELSTYSDEKGRIFGGYNNVFSVWKHTDENIKKNKYVAVLTLLSNLESHDLINNAKFVYCINKNTSQEVRTEKFSEVFENVQESNDERHEFSRALIRDLPYTDVKNINESTILKVDYDSKIYEQLLQKNSDKSKPIYLVIKDVSHLNLEQIKKLEKEGLDIQFIGFKNKNPIQGLPYDIKTYKLIRQEIEQMFGNTDLNEDKNMIFFQIIKKICQNVAYDSDATASTYAKNAGKKVFTSRNLEGALLDNKCVCAGYSELVVNLCAEFGIDAISVCGQNHAWNQVKLNEKWYNLDVTWNRDRIKDYCSDKKDIGIPKWFLKSDSEFRKDNKHIPYNISKQSYVCDTSFPIEELESVLRPVQIEQPSVLTQQEILPDSLFSETRISEVAETLNVLKEVAKSKIEKQETKQSSLEDKSR